MKTDFLFFFNNRLEAGQPLSDKSRKLSLHLAVHYAVQLANAGLFCKQNGIMPESLSLKDLSVTKDGFLFLREGVSLSGEFDESEFLKSVYRLFLQIFLRRETLPEEKTLGQLIVNYPRQFTTALESLAGGETTLVHFKWRILEHWKNTAMDYRLLFFRYQCELPESVPFVLLPFCNILMPAVEKHARYHSDISKLLSIPFGTYNWFCDKFSFLNLPKHSLEHLPSPEGLKARILTVLKQSSGLFQEPVTTVITENGLDSYSLDIFRWLAEQIPVRFIILSRQPYAGCWNRELETGTAVLWNPRADGNLSVGSGMLPRFDTAVFPEQAKSKTGGALSPVLQWMEYGEKWRNEFSLESLGLNPEEKEALLSGKSNRLLQLKGLAEPSGIPFSSGTAPLERVSDKIIRILNSKKGNGVPSLLKELNREPGLFLMARSAAQNREKVTDEVKSLLSYAAGLFRTAARQLEKIRQRPEFAPLYADSLFESGELDKMLAFCRKQGIEPSCYHFLMAQRGKRFDMEKLKPEHLFQILLMQGKLEELEKQLSRYAKEKGKDSLFYEFKGELTFRTDPSRGEQLLRKGIHVAGEQKMLYRKAFVLKRLGNALFRISRFQDAEVCYYQAMEVFVSLENAWQFEKVAYNMAMVDMNLCRLDAAADVFRKDLKQNRESGHRRYVVFNLKALGKVAAMAYRFEEASALLTEALKLARDGGFTEEITGIHYMLVSVYLELEKFDQARHSLEKLKKMTAGQPFWDTQIQLLTVDFHRKKGERENAKAALLRIQPDHLSPDELRYTRVLDALIHPRPLARVSDLYEDVGNADLKQFVFILRSLLLDAYPRLVNVVDEEQLKQDYRQVRLFNSVLAARFRHHFLSKKRSFLDPEIFTRLSRIMAHGRKNEQASFYHAFRQLGKWAGFNVFELRTADVPAEKGMGAISTPNGRLFLDMQPEPEEDLHPFLEFVVNFAASVMPRGKLDIQGGDNTEKCPYLSMIVGHSPAIMKLKHEIARAADFMFPVLVTGESGTGKELTARAVHFCSSRKDKPFLAINCAALPDNLMESELFGYVRGAFTGAQVSRAGLLESARDGTLFLDEIGEMPMATQAKLLRVLQEREYFRLGDSTPRKVQARFVFATNRNLEEAVKEKRFREDLFYRIAGFRLKTPSLNERREDIPELADYLLSQMDDGSGKKLSPEARELLTGYRYRGNIRELQNILMMGIVNAGAETEIRPEHLPVLSKTVPISYSGKLKQATRAFQKEYLKKVLEENSYNNSKTGRILGITRQRVIQLRKDYGL
ncbi:MAG: AAA domain-containing protein [Acidobacteria bacterium]|nr:AAA domain-containing protein [Acidobacteriota bacterium]